MKYDVRFFMIVCEIVDVVVYGVVNVGLMLLMFVI